jgi:hypothetical protein
MSGGASGAGAFRDSQTDSSSSSTSREHGGAAQPCPHGTLNVTVNYEGDQRPRGRVRTRVAGPQSRSSRVRGGGTATFRRIQGGAYTVMAELRGWRQRAPNPAPVTVPQGAAGNVAVTLYRCELERVDPRGSPDPEDIYINKTGQGRWIAAHLSTRERGVTVYFTLDEHRRNKTGLQASLKGSVSPASATTDANGVARTTLTLGRYGGDRFRVSASLEQNKRPGSRGTKQSKWFRVWRKVYCEVDCMHRPDSGTYANRAQTPAMKTEYRNNYILVEDTGADSQPAHKRTIAEDDAGGYCRPLRSGTDTPMVHFVYMDSIIWDPANQRKWIQLRRTTGRKDFDAATTTVHLEDSADPDRWLKGTTQVEIQERQRDGTTTTTTNNLANPTNHLTMTWVGDKFRLAWNLQNVMGLGNSNRFPRNVRRVRIRVTLEVWEEGSGLAAGGASIVGMRFRERSYRGSGLTNRIRKTMIHESGHNMGMASKYASDGSQPATYYERYGPHCNNNSNRCVMYGILSTHYRYCNVCQDGLRARDLSALPIGGSSAL